jgi:energy-converting hydrogenase B subunit D
MLVITTIVLCIGIVISGLLAVYLKSVVSAVVTAGLAGLFASVTYVLLGAPDVAMTEAAIGSGLTTLVFLYAIHKTKMGEGVDDE